MAKSPKKGQLGPHLEAFVASTHYAGALAPAENGKFDIEWRKAIIPRLQLASPEPRLAFSSTLGDAATTFTKAVLADDERREIVWLLTNTAVGMKTDDGFHLLGWRLHVPAAEVRQFPYMPIPYSLLALYHPPKKAILAQIEKHGGVFTSQMAEPGHESKCYTALVDGRFFPWDIRYVLSTLGYELADGVRLLNGGAREAISAVPDPVAPAKGKRGKKSTETSTDPPPVKKLSKKAAAAAAAAAVAAAQPPVIAQLELAEAEAVPIEEPPPVKQRKIRTPKNGGAGKKAAPRRRLDPLANIVQAPEPYAQTDADPPPAEPEPASWLELVTAAAEDTAGNTRLYVIPGVKPIRLDEPIKLPPDVADALSGWGPAIVVPVQEPFNPTAVLLNPAHSLKEWPIVGAARSVDSTLDRMLNIIEETDDYKMNPLLPDEQGLLSHAFHLAADPIKLAHLTIRQVLAWFFVVMDSHWMHRLSAKIPRFPSTSTTLPHSTC